LVWQGIDPAKVAREDLWHMFRRGDAVIEAARLTANVARREAGSLRGATTLTNTSRTPVRSRSAMPATWSSKGIVSKRLGSRYRSGRTTDWLEFQNHAPAVRREEEQDFWGG
jgi:ATP-dependent DNA ligase